MPRVAKSTLEKATETKTTSTENKPVEVVETEKTVNTETKPVQEKKEEKTKIIEGKYILVCEKKANKCIYGTTGELICFDSKGKAIVSTDEAKHFEKIPGYTIQNQ